MRSAVDSLDYACPRCLKFHFHFHRLDYCYDLPGLDPVAGGNG
jgi:hypothetical protein